MKVLLDDGAYIPERAHPADAGYDLRSRDDRWVHPGQHSVFDTGVHVEIPIGFVGMLTSKSGLMGKGLTSRGTIDAEYTGPIRVVLYNHGEDGYLVRKGDKISQLVVMPIATPEIEIVQALDETERGSGGFGSTGR